MRLLALGATGFLSSAVVRAAAERGHDVVGLTRTPGPLPEGVRPVHADREDPASLRDALASLGTWRPDAVVDSCGWTVKGARVAAEVLADVPAYAYVSSVAAYAAWPTAPTPDESGPTWGPDADLDQYGPMKAESERALREALGDRLLSVRSGLILGPGDDTRRLTWWLDRIANQDRVVVPEADVPMSVVDVRDLATWTVAMVERGDAMPGEAVNAVGPRGMTTYHGLLEACRAAVAATGGTPATFVPVSDERIIAAGVQPWHELPHWFPEPIARTSWDVGTDRARELGLAWRPVEETVLDSWRWALEAGLEHGPVPENVLPERIAA